MPPTVIASQSGFRRILGAAIAIALVATGVVFTTTSEAEAASQATIWGTQTPAGVRLDSDTSAVELGTRFTPTVNGAATGIRFFKVAGVTGRHAGSLWTTAGQRIGSLSFANETTSGWQQATFAAPIALKAGQSYVVSYSVPAGGKYAATGDHTAKSASSALQVTSRDSGRYSYGAVAAVPQSVWRSTQYWVDVTFAAGSTPTASPTPTQSPKPTASPSPTQAPKPTPIATPAAPPTTPSTGAFPTRESAGLPAGWSPSRSISGDLWLRQAGQVVENLRITNGTIYIAAPNVTIRRIEAVNTHIINGYGSTCQPGLVVQDSEFTASGTTSDRDLPVIGHGGYTASNIMIDGVPEGLRVGGSDVGCGPVSVSRSFIRVTSPTVCNDWHGDGIQGYGGARLTVRQSTIVMTSRGGCGGTAPFFYPHSQGNTSVDIDGLLVQGGGYPFRNGMPGPVKNLKVVDGSWGYGPVDVRCSVVQSWQAHVVRLDSAGQPVNLRTIGCTGRGN